MKVKEDGILNRVSEQTHLKNLESYIGFCKKCVPHHPKPKEAAQRRSNRLCRRGLREIEKSRQAGLNEEKRVQ